MARLSRINQTDAPLSLYLGIRHAEVCGEEFGIDRDVQGMLTGMLAVKISRPVAAKHEDSCL